MKHLHTKFHHCAISVREMERTVAFYAYLGFEEVVRWSASDGSLAIAHLANGPTFLEVFCYSKNASAAVETQESGPELESVGVRHFALQVEDLRGAHETLTNEHRAPTAIVSGRTGIEYFFVRDPDGIWFEIVSDDRDLLRTQ